jgi:micrococcal nuclease
MAESDVDRIQRTLRFRRGSSIAAIALLGMLVLSACLSHRSAPPNARNIAGQSVHVVRVIDGDTIVIRDNVGKQEHVRLRGIDAPEMAHDDRPADYWSSQATESLRQRVDQRDVVLQIDGTETRDRFGRILAFVYVADNDCVNMDLVRDGHVYADRRFTSFMRSQLEQAETDARKRGRGLWKDEKVEQMPAWRRAWLDRRGQASGDR